MASRNVLPVCTLFLLHAILLSAPALAGGAITLAVDATDSPGNLLHARETIAVRPGPLTLFYPKWIPGEHGPTGPIADLVGLAIDAQGAPLRWRRDLVEMYAIHCEVPPDVSTITVTYDFILPPTIRGFSSAASSTPGLLVLSWNQVVLYPEDERPDSIMVTPSLKLFDAWEFGTALHVEERENNEIRFTPVPLNVLIDSPVLAGLHFRRVDVTAGMTAPHAIDMVSDDAAALDMSDWLVDRYKQLVIEANALFGAHHYDHYDFLYTLSDQVAHFGLEHHQSSDDRVGKRTLLDEQLRLASASLLSHEFVHSWNGKYRRPAGLATADYATPMKDDLLWVYEGLTEYLGDVLAARAGLRTPLQYREALALVAAGMDARPGRAWRPLQDAADEAPILYEAREDWDAYRRDVDFYDEGELIWLEADVTIRQHTGGKKSLDDFCRLFFGAATSGPTLRTYTYEDVIAALNEIAPYDWNAFLSARLQSLSPHAPLGGIEEGGWKLVYRDTVTTMLSAYEEERERVDLRFSLGLLVNKDSSVLDVIPGSAGALAGLVPTMKLLAVNGKEYSPETLRDAVREATGGTSPIELLTSQAGYFKTVNLNYHEGEKYPLLVREEGKPDVLDAIIAPLAPRKR